jgi:hypothetical protein
VRSAASKSVFALNLAVFLEIILFSSNYLHFDFYFRLTSRGESITEALQTVDDFDGQLHSFSQWLHKIEQDINYLEDYCLKSEDANSTKQTVIELYQVS